MHSGSLLDRNKAAQFDMLSDQEVKDVEAVRDACQGLPLVVKIVSSALARGLISENGLLEGLGQDPHHGPGNSTVR